MGLCSSSENLSKEEAAERRKQKEMSRALDSKISADHHAEQQVNKLLLLGAGESGKSTLFKQMIKIYGDGYTEADRKGFVTIINNNIITSMKTLCQNVELYKAVGPDAQASMDFVNQLKGDEEIDATLGKHLKTLWADDGIQATYAHRSNFQLTDSAGYFFDRLDRVSHPDYIPDDQDVLRSRVRTTGIVENDFTIDGNKFKMFDVGGQRNERKKWIHCFEGVTAVMFVAAISEYDQKLYEDENTNRMDEALTLFHEICNLKWFAKTSMILFLNKRDLFEEKIQRVPLSAWEAGGYTGENTYEATTQWLVRKFEDQNQSKEKKVYPHITCATDTNNVEAVFNAAKDIIITQSLEEAGLV